MDYEFLYRYALVNATFMGDITAEQEIWLESSLMPHPVPGAHQSVANFLAKRASPLRSSPLCTRVTVANDSPTEAASEG